MKNKKDKKCCQNKVLTNVMTAEWIWIETKNQRTGNNQGILRTRWKSTDEKYEKNGKTLWEGQS